jgi:hypothetical protein
MKLKFEFLPFSITLGTPWQNAKANPCPPLKSTESYNVYCKVFVKKPPCLHQHFHTNSRLRKNDVPIVQFVPSSWVVEMAREIVKSECCNFLTQFRAAKHCQRHHQQLRAAISSQDQSAISCHGQLSTVMGSCQQSKAAFGSHLTTFIVSTI